MTRYKSQTFQALVQEFFVTHLAIERQAGKNTITAYRDAIKLFLTYASSQQGSTPDQLDHTVLEIDTIRSFISWLQQERGCGERTRNHRLAVLKSLARYIASVAPEHLERCRLIREIKPASVDHREVQYLTQDEVVALIATTDKPCAKGRRDRVILLLLYNTGARVQEIVDLNIGDIQEQPIGFVRLQGKGRKQRTCPLWPRTIAAVRRMLNDRTSTSPEQPLFLSARGRRLSRSGITYILRRAQKNCALQPEHAKRLSPHVIRHTTAMHLLESGTDITTIAAWLGHSQLETTHNYVEISLRMKQAALASDAALPELRDGQYPTADIVDWLVALSQGPSYVQSKATKPPNTGPRTFYCA